MADKSEMWIARIFLGDRCLGEKRCYSFEHAQIEAERMFRRQKPDERLRTFIAPVS